MSETEQQTKPPTADRPRHRRIVTAAGAAVIIAGAAVGLTYAVSGPAPQPLAVDAEGRTQTVRRMNLDITVKQEGELAAVSNVEVRNEVQGRRTITYLIAEGTRVKAGDVLARLDGEDLETQIERLESDLVRAEMNLAEEREQLAWQLSQNAADIESAQVALSLAEMELAKYEQGQWPKQYGEAQAKLEKATTKLEAVQEELQTTLALYSRGFVTVKKVKEDRQAVTDAERDVDSARIALEVLEEYEHPMAMQVKQNNLRQAQNRLDRQQVRNKSAENNRRVRVTRAEESVKKIQERLDYYREQFAACTITAPEPGLVVYHDDRRNTIAEGEQAHHRQTLMLLPDTDRMKAIVRVPENRVSLIRKGMPAVIAKASEGFRPLTATVEKISVLAESNGRWYDSESRDYPVDLVLARTPEGLKPGLKVEATVFVERMKDVLAVPLSCVYTQAETAFVFVRDASNKAAGIEPRPIDLGRANETHAQIVKGLTGGEEIIELKVGEGRRLLERFGLANDPAGSSDPLGDDLSDAATVSSDASPVPGH